jgi:hypothetical protein
MGCNVGTFQGGAHAKWCETGEEAINHVAALNGWNELGAATYDHFFIYPDEKCPYDEKDEETGEVKYKPHCIPLSKVDHDLEDYGGIPEHLRGPIEAKEKEQRVRAEEFRKGQQEAEEERRKEEQRKQDERQLEHLRQKLGK